MLSKRLKEKYPEEMTVVLQHRFWDLIVTDERFEVKLTFDGIPERLVIPFAAIKVFFDPSVPYGLQFEEADARAPARTRQLRRRRAAMRRKPPPRSLPPAATAGQRAEKKPRACAAQADKAEEKARSAGGADKRRAKHPAAMPSRARPQPASRSKVVSIDAFRKK